MKSSLLLGIAALAVTTLIPAPVLAHCDTLDGPVVKDARLALEAGDPMPILKWVPTDREGEVRQAFEEALAVRSLGPEARSLADRLFFETLVRIHRAGEGAPYTGLQPAGAAVDPGIAASDAALESGTIEPLLELIERQVDQGLRQRHARAAEARRHASESVEKGREYVAAYVDLMHYAEGLLAAAGPTAYGHGAEHSH
jgi:hypothetical protein